MRTHNNTRGNILFLILLAVVLFAALSYAVTSSLRSGGKDASSETISQGAAAITSYVALLRNEVQRLMLVNGCTLANLDWRHDVYKRYNGTYTYNAYSGAPPSPKAGCAVFNAYGGPVTPQTFEKYKDANYETFMLANNTGNWRAGHGSLRWVNRVNELTDKNEIAFFVNGIDKNICAYLLNPASPPTTLPNDDYILSTDANSPEPALITSTNRIDDPVNLVGDFFADTTSMSSASDTYCNLGAVIVPQ